MANYRRLAALFLLLLSSANIAVGKIRGTYDEASLEATPSEGVRQLMRHRGGKRMHKGGHGGKEKGIKGAGKEAELETATDEHEETDGTTGPPTKIEETLHPEATQAPQYYSKSGKNSKKGYQHKGGKNNSVKQKGGKSSSSKDKGGSKEQSDKSKSGKKGYGSKGYGSKGGKSKDSGSKKGGTGKYHQGKAVEKKAKSSSEKGYDKSHYKLTKSSDSSKKPWLVIHDKNLLSTVH